MQYALTQTVAPTAEPVTRAEAKLHLRQTVSVEDSLIDVFIKMARGYCETKTHRQFMLATYKLQLDAFPDSGHISHGHARSRSGSTFYGEIRLPLPPLSSVPTVAYVDTSGDPQTLTVTTDYVVDSSALIPRIVPAWNTTWPSTRDQPNAVTVTFIVGYASADDVPPEAKGAILMMVTDLDRHRSAQSELRITKNETVDRLLAVITVPEVS